MDYNFKYKPYLKWASWYSRLGPSAFLACNLIILIRQDQMIAFDLSTRELIEQLAPTIEIISSRKKIHRSVSRIDNDWSQMFNDSAYVHAMNTERVTLHVQINTLRPKQNGRHCPGDVFKHILLNENIGISIKISLKLLPQGLINNNHSALMSEPITRAN